MQECRSDILGKIEFSIDVENADKTRHAAITNGVTCRGSKPKLTFDPINAIEGLKLMHMYELHEYTM